LSDGDRDVLQLFFLEDRLKTLSLFKIFLLYFSVPHN
jgi:hypothetical protein